MLVYDFGLPDEEMAAAAPGSHLIFQLGGKKSEVKGRSQRLTDFENWPLCRFWRGGGVEGNPSMVLNLHCNDQTVT